MTRGTFQVDDWKIVFSKSDKFCGVSFSHIGCLSPECDHWVDAEQEKKINFIMGYNSSMSGYFQKAVPNPYEYRAKLCIIENENSIS